MDLLDDEAGGRESDGLIHYQSSLDTPIMPLVAYAKEDDDYNLFDDKLTARIPKISISLSDNITNHLGTQK